MDSLKALKDLLFIDIETVSEYPDFRHLPEKWKTLWEKKSAYWQEREGTSPDEAYTLKAGIYAEFSKVIAIGLGYFHFPPESKEPVFRTKVLAGHQEKELLLEFKTLLETRFDVKKTKFVAHNGKEFDYPFLSRRMLVHQLTLPLPFAQLQNLKPWDVPHQDTLEMWRFGDRKNYTSLELLAELFGIPTPKTHISGETVHKAYYHDEALDAIVEYCQHDVIATARLYLKLKGLPDWAAPEKKEDASQSKQS